MGYPTKIATCCHCGSKTMLTLDTTRHELACASCGAPLHDLKMLPKRKPQPKPAKAKRRAVSHHPDVRRFERDIHAEAVRKRKPRKVKRRKSWLKGLAEEIFDVVEDIFD